MTRWILPILIVSLAGTTVACSKKDSSSTETQVKTGSTTDSKPVVASNKHHRRHNRDKHAESP
jgi:hypothetical protein